MKVRLIAKTDLAPGVFDVAADTGYRLTNEQEDVGKVTYPEMLIEFAGRACYQSWERPNPKTAANKDYIDHILDVKHLSVIEHASATFYIEDVSRSLTHELVRHRHFSFSQLSQRFVSMQDAHPVIPPALRDNEYARREIFLWFKEAIGFYEDLVKKLEAEGKTRKQAREAARCVLPNCTPTSIVITANLRSYIEFIQKRNSPAADAEIQELAVKIQELLATYLSPTIFKKEWNNAT